MKTSIKVSIKEQRIIGTPEAAVQGCSVCKRGVLRNFAKFTKKCLRQSFFFNKVTGLIKLQALVCSFIKKETLAQVFPCEFCEISKNTFSCRTSPVAASCALSRVVNECGIQQNQDESRINIIFFGDAGDVTLRCIFWGHLCFFARRAMSRL